MTIGEAAEAGDIEQLRALLEAGEDPNAPETEEYWPPLLEAVYHNQVEAARLLLDAGADMYGLTNGGESALQVAVQGNSLQVQRLLLERGYQLSIERDAGSGMLHSAVAKDNLEIVRWLLANGADVHATDFQGCTALIPAAHGDHLECVEALLQAGADPNHRDDDTETVLMWAADHSGNTAVLRTLIQAGAEVNAVSNVGGTALTWAVRRGDPEMVQVLLDAGAKSDLSADLVYVAYHGSLSMVRLLLERGAECTATDSSGKSALDYAKNRGHREIANLLRQAESDQRLRATGETYPPPRYAIGTHVRTHTRTPREGWIVLIEWHYKRGAWGYFIEVTGTTQVRKTVSTRYWEEEIEVLEVEQEAGL